MCGIAGFVAGRGARLPPDLLTRMGDAQAPRGPDDRGALVLRPRTGEALDASRGCALEVGDVALGHLRLSILDLSPAGHQPMSLEGRLFVAYNGEIYNYVELRQELTALGRTFRTQSDTEVLLHAYDAWGEACLERFNGMWSFALWDAREGRLFCAVDHAGIKPLHYGTVDGTFAFASEIKALLEVPGTPREIEEDHALLYLVTGIDHGDETTFFRGIRRLLPGTSLTLTPGGTPVVRRWWRPTPGDAPRTDDEAARVLGELLRDSIRLRYRSDVPVGITLSGGVDSVALACTARDMANAGEMALPNGLRTFTAVDPGGRIDEGPRAMLAAKRAGAEAFTVQADPARLANDDVLDLVRTQDEPFPGLSVYMQYCVMRLVRASGTVVTLSGQGADELLLGYPWQVAYSVRDLLAEGRVGAALTAARDGSKNAGIGAARLGAYLAAARFPKLRALRYNQRVGALLHRGARHGTLTELLERSLGTGSGAAMLEREVEQLGLPGLLRYEDRNSMRFSVESRLPYLDYRIMNFAYSLPSYRKVVGGWRKYPLRKAVEHSAPAEIVWNRAKIGFAAPDERLLQALRGNFLEAFDGDVRSGALVDAAAVRRLAQSSHAMPAWSWRVLNLELWMRTFGVSVVA